MAFSVNYGRGKVVDRRTTAPPTVGRVLKSVIILFALFCIYDYSSYGDGYVSAALGHAQREFQSFMNRFRVRV